MFVEVLRGEGEGNKWLKFGGKKTTLINSNKQSY